LFEALFKYGRDDYARSELVYQGDWPTWLLYAIAVIAATGVATLLYRRRGSAHWSQLAAIGALQLAMVAVVIWMLLQPTLATDRLRDGENTVALVLDSSGSMAYGTDDNRFEVAQSSLAAALSDDDAPDLTVRHYELGAGASAVDNFVASTPTASATALGDSLKDILEEARYNPLAAVVLSSDGADTNGGLTADELTELGAYGVPIHTIGVGEATMPDDIELADVTVPDKALPGSTISARVTIRHDSPGQASVKVYDDDELLQLVPVELKAGAGTTTAWVEVELAEAGPHELRFSVERAETDIAEVELRNNTRGSLVNVANEEYRILYFEGEPRWEYKFMRRAVANDEDLRIATLLRVSPNKFYRQGIDTPEQLESGFPTTRDELFGYDALIIGSVEAASLTPEQQSIIRDFVSERGGSLLMLAGPGGLGNGGWGQSEIADVLPARLPPTSTDSFHRKKAPVSLTPQGQGSQMLRFAADPDDNRAAWQELPEVADYQLTGNLKPAAVTLLNADTEFGVIPLLITQPYGRGHAYIMASGGTWRWQMSLPLEDQKHEMYWRQLLRALVASAPESVSLRASAAGEGGAIMLRAEFRDEAFRPVDDVGVTAVASHESGETLSVNLVPGEEPGVFAGALTPPQPGTWYFEALAERDGEPVAVGRSSILHEASQAEYFGFRMNAGLLQRLSAATGGTYFDAGDLDGLSDLLRYSSSGITETEYRAIWDAPIIFLLLLALKGGEWLLRRRWRSI
jgi:uncharacterized membrane protein